jgi:hypothetical protein
MLNVSEPITPFASVTKIVKVNVPAAVGVPLITPVAAFNVHPVGNEPVKANV